MSAKIKYSEADIEELENCIPGDWDREGRTCPNCGADRGLLKKMLKEEPVDYLETENHSTARLLIGNCPACSKAFCGKVGGR